MIGQNSRHFMQAVALPILHIFKIDLVYDGFEIIGAVEELLIDGIGEVDHAFTVGVDVGVVLFVWEGMIFETFFKQKKLLKKFLKKFIQVNPYL